MDNKSLEEVLGYNILFGPRMKTDIRFSFYPSNLTVCLICNQACNKRLSDIKNSKFIISVFSYDFVSLSKAEVVCLALTFFFFFLKNHILVNVNYPRAGDQGNRLFSSFSPLFSFDSVQRLCYLLTPLLEKGQRKQKKMKES